MSTAGSAASTPATPLATARAPHGGAHQSSSCATATGVLAELPPAWRGWLALFSAALGCVLLAWAAQAVGDAHTARVQKEAAGGAGDGSHFQLQQDAALTASAVAATLLFLGAGVAFSGTFLAARCLV